MGNTSKQGFNRLSQELKREMIVVWSKMEVVKVLRSRFWIMF